MKGDEYILMATALTGDDDNQVDGSRIIFNQKSR